MKNDHRNSDDIEREIDDERAQMSDTIDDLQKKFSVDAIVTDLGNMFREQGGDLGRAVSQTLGRNPAAVALVGVGLAWLFLGQNQNHPAAKHPSDQGHDRRGNRQATGRGDTTAWPNTRSNEGSFSDDDRYWYGNGQISGNRRLQGRDTGSGATANGLGHATSELTERLSDGLHELSEEAKARVVAARRVAHEARLSSEAAISKGSRAASDFFEDRPLVVGALAVALGAAIGSALPHSRIEDDTLGESSDQLFADAQSVFREERAKAMAVVRSAATDVKDEIGKVGSELADLLPEDKSVGEVIVDRASGSAARVMGGAMDEAETQGLGRRRN